VLGDSASPGDGAGVDLGAAAAFDVAGLLADPAAAQHRGTLGDRGILGNRGTLDRSLAGLTPVVARPFSPYSSPCGVVLLVVVVVL
jgi:hypothetical protein